MYDATNIKHKRLQTAHSPRLILLGGSNLLYGIESEQIKSRTGYEPVNMGMIGGLRLEYSLREIEQNVHQNDLIVLSLEYPTLLTNASRANPQVLMRLLWSRPDNWQNLAMEHWRLLTDAGAQQQLSIALRKAIDNIFVNKKKNSYKSFIKFNKYGDLITYRKSNQKRIGKSQGVIPKKFRIEKLDKNITRLNNFYNFCLQHGAKVVFTHPPVPEKRFINRQTVAEKIHNRLQDKLKIPIITTQKCMVFPNEDFINISYHLHGEAISTRTERLIESILYYLKHTDKKWNQPGFIDELSCL